MIVTSVPTEIVGVNDDLTAVIARALPEFEEGDVLAVAGKIVSLCEGRVRPADTPLTEIVEQESDDYLPPNGGPYPTWLTRKRDLLIPNAGADYSNAHGLLLLWPSDPQKSAERIYDFLRAHYGVKRCGVIITDSAPVPLQWGVRGVCMAHCGFRAVYSVTGQTDLCGRELKMTRIATAQALAAAAVLCMGEADESTPLARIQSPPYTVFTDGAPTAEETAEARIAPEHDFYAPLLRNAEWRKKRPESSKRG